MSKLRRRRFCWVESVLSRQVALGRAMAGEMKIMIMADLRAKPVINLATAMAAAVRLAKETKPDILNG